MPDDGQIRGLTRPMILLRILAALIGLGACGLLALVVAERLVRSAGVVVRLLAALCLAFWAGAWGFSILALLRGFHLLLIVPLFVALPLGLVLRRRDEIAAVLNRTKSDLAQEIRAIATAVGEHRLAALGLAAIGVHIALRGLRSLVTPALGWDDFSYHLFRAGRWVQNGGLRLEPAPDAWTYYEFFPWGGDLLWAWALVWRISDVLVPVVAFAIWVGVLLAAFALARQLGQGRLTALIVAAAVSVVPSQVSQLATAYVDNAVLLTFLLASLFLLLRTAKPSSDDERRAPGPLAIYFLFGAACALGLSVKISSLPFFGLAGLIVLWDSARRRAVGPFTSFLAGSSVVVPNLLFNWVQRGSPVYPFRIAEWLPYNEAFQELLVRFPYDDPVAAASRALIALMSKPPLPDPFLNIGWVGLPLVCLGLIGATRAWRRRSHRLFVFWSLFFAAFTVSQLLNPQNASMLTWWLNSLGRFIVPSFAGILLLAGSVSDTALRRLVLPVLVIEYFAHAPWAWPGFLVVAMAIVTFAGVGCFAFAAVLARRPSRRWAAWLVWAYGAVAFVTVTVGVRESVRHRTYRYFADGLLDDFHTAGPARDWPLWERLDRESGGRVAASSGFGELTGQNWFRYPLLGSRLQHDVVYVPVTGSGELVSYEDPKDVESLADRRAWLERLEAGQIDWVVALGPPTVEHAWIQELPEVFIPEWSVGQGHSVLVRVDREGLATTLGPPS